MKQSKQTLKTYFETGDKPTQQQYADLIDSYIDSKQPTGAANRRFVINADGNVSVAPELGILQSVEFVDSNDADSKKDSLKFTFANGNIISTSITELLDTGVFSGLSKLSGDDKYKVNFNTVGGSSTALDLKDWFDEKMNDNEPTTLTLTPVMNGQTTESHETTLDVGQSKDGVFWIDDLPASSNGLLTIKLTPKTHKFYASIVLLIKSNYTVNRKLKFQYATGSGAIYDVFGKTMYHNTHKTDLIAQTDIIENSNSVPQIMRFDIGVWFYKIGSDNIADVEIVKKIGRRLDGQ